VLAFFIFIIIPYAYHAAMRSGTQECSRETHESYIGELCYTPREWGMVFRLYDAHSGELLAERDFLDPDVKGLLWIDNQVQYDFSPEDGKGFVVLPPTWLDRLRAKLP
jgi:hypothetical protein